MTTRDVAPFRFVQRAMMHHAPLGGNRRREPTDVSKKNSSVIYARELKEAAIAGHAGSAGWREQGRVYRSLGDLINHPFWVANAQARDIVQIFWGRWGGL